MNSKKDRGKMKIKRIVSLLVSLNSAFTMSIFTVSKCSALDMTHDYYEELELLENKLVYKPCWGHEEDECEKYLFRYEQVPALIERLKELIKENNYKNTKEVVQKIGIGATGLAGAGLGLYFCPLPTIAATMIATLGLSTTCAVHKEIIEPSHEAVAIMVTPGLLTGIKIAVTAFLAKQIKKMINWISGDKPKSNVDRGLVGNALNVLCGDATKENQNYGVLEGIRVLTFGNVTNKSNVKKIKKHELYSRLLKDLYAQIKNGDFKGNDIIVLSTDFTDLDNVKGAVGFSKTNIDLNYNELLEKYFKNI